MDLSPIQQAFELALKKQKSGQLTDAIAIYRQLLKSLPQSPELRVNLAVALKDTGNIDEAIQCFQEALALKPDSSKIWNNLGVAFKVKGQVDDAIDSFEKALEREPNSAIAWNNLGLVHQDAGRINSAIDCFDRALAIDPTLHSIDSNRLYALHFDERSDARSLYLEHQRWAARHAGPLKQLIRAFTNDRSPNRKLRVGYVSPDFREHVVGRFLIPLLAAHNREQFEVHCYNAKAGANDSLTEQLRSHCDGWHEIANLTDDQAAQLIRDDRIDILVDLSLHMSENRMLLFARKPAPVQVTYLGYCSTTGLDAIDYRITDPHLDPPDGDESVYAEKSIHLPETYWCYSPPIETAEPEVKSLDQITFGCLNNFCKVNSTALKAWCEILRAVPNSRLILHAHQGKHRYRVFDVLKNEGVAPSRLEFVSFQPIEKYFEQYRQMDIALDTFPYAGGTTTCDALWMGVPVVTLADQTAVGRGGVSILSNVGLQELVAHSTAEYVNVAVKLAGDLPRLLQLRKSLRQRMKSSPLMNATRFAANMEMVYRQIWENWIVTES